MNMPPVTPPPPPVAPPPQAAEYWGNDANMVFVEGSVLTSASRTSLQWEQEQLENTVMFSATGQGVRTIFHNGESNSFYRSRSVKKLF